MPISTWHQGINQKVQGALNLHNALRGRDSGLEFFLMLSSITGSIGTAAESNYCAANAFLDSFAGHRRSHGLPATSLGLGMISEIGFLHENPDIEAALLRKGVHPFTEDELIQIIDIALTPPPEELVSDFDQGLAGNHYGQAHLLTGLELYGFQTIRDKGFKRGTQVLEDPRCAIIAGEFANSSDSDHGEGAESQTDNGLPQSVAAGITSCEENAVPNETLLTAILAIVTERLATLLLVPPAQLQQHMHLAEFGVESMLAAEFRGDMVRTFGVDVSFAMLLDRRTNIDMVVDMVAVDLLARKVKS
ncbi:hypothetical protein HO133_003433 [Letharia lupina]|uniref:Ketoreductase domain-containing protein n=1 Tax=Letharia lupina TaxID=560253 RepID=A0A8H6CBQ7_9LECA|nr:uncharacterized protein HO133_003433 [Letharia lupina]KAF6220301.1 hypothetical protein HO133_003433 [Letharia lupina]